MLQGDKVVEVRLHGVDKGRVVRKVVAHAPSGALLFAMGDDRTDEDLFAALPERGLAVHVGLRGPTGGDSLVLPQLGLGFD